MKESRMRTSERERERKKGKWRRKGGSAIQAVITISDCTGAIIRLFTILSDFSPALSARVITTGLSDPNETAPRLIKYPSVLRVLSYSRVH